ncbi:uncharacterized protein M421DRAFT_424414 [Didymella exigua CBS 183.55]|uniref:Uncharacterized protein n=1 Tax=Didymella exigua CBS 183.55 TaxID=1150837 RepID=A0A6A5RE09_9PLEO|nr:uncharacterized protein M421DRAFT_424414 [Didymella exigua CBS 183.55]KAF1924776.1 hypothetical protein M421DRAFT_424414 [Didymella exigua CBS 183.55]
MRLSSSPPRVFIHAYRMPRRQESQRSASGFAGSTRCHTCGCASSQHGCCAPIRKRKLSAGRSLDITTAKGPAVQSPCLALDLCSRILPPVGPSSLKHKVARPVWVCTARSFLCHTNLPHVRSRPKPHTCHCHFDASISHTDSKSTTPVPES